MNFSSKINKPQLTCVVVFSTPTKMAAQFTCITCGVKFKDAEIQKLHFKSDWHRYNLKLKVAGFGPVSAEEFQKLVLDQRNLLAENDKDKSMYCEICRKSFSGEQTYSNHLASKKHKEREENGPVVRPEKPVLVEKEEPMAVESDDTDSEVEEVSSDEWNEEDENNPINKNDCLFCHHHSKSLPANLKHMTEAHSFFVPDIEYCVDLKGMLLYLGAKIFDGNICLWCGEKGKTFHSLQAVQKHMVKKNTKILCYLLFFCLSDR